MLKLTNEKSSGAIKLSALLSGRAIDAYTRMSNVNDCDKLKKTLLTRYNFSEDGYRQRFRDVKPETDGTPDQFIVRLKIYLALLDLTVKEQFFNACSDELALYLLERGPNHLVG